MKKLFLLLILFILTGYCFGQVSVSLQQPPPNQLRAADLWKLTLINSSRNTLQVTLYGTLEEATAGNIADGNSKPMVLPPGIKKITYDDVKTGNVNFKSGKWQNAFTQTGNAPSGDYTICIHVKDLQGNEIGSGCINQSVQIVSAPVLNSPADGDSIPTMPMPSFTWMPSMPAPSGQFTYKLKIVEIIGNQSSIIAIQSNPSFFEKSDIRTTQFQYSISGRTFDPNKKYAWTVQCIDNSGLGIGENNGLAAPFEFITKPNIVLTGNSHHSPSLHGTMATAVGDTIRAGLNGEFKVILTQVTTDPDSSLTGNGNVYIHWLMTSVAVEFKKIKIDTTKRLTSGGIVTTQSGSSSTSYQAYPLAWAQSLLSGPGVANVVDNTMSWTNNQVNDLVTWTNGLNFGQPQINFNSNIAPPAIPNNALKMPFGLQFNNGNQKLVITEMVFKQNESKVNFLAQENFSKSGTQYKLGFAGKYFQFHPNSIDFSNGRVELVDDFTLPNTTSSPKMKFKFKKGATNSGCYVQWADTGITGVSLGLEIKFSRDWLTPIPTSTDSVVATISGNGTSMQDILLTGNLPDCEIVGTNGMKIQVDSIALDFSDTRNPAGMFFPKNYTNDTSAAAKLLWQGLYVKKFNLTLPESWKTGAYPTSISANDLIIDDQGITVKVKAINVVTFSTGSVANLSASVDTLNFSMLKGSLTNATAKGLLVLPISKDTITNTLKYIAAFNQVSNGNSFVITVVPSGPIDADVLRGKMTLDPTSNITAVITPTLKTFSIMLDGSFSWDNPDFSSPGVAAAFQALGIKMEMDFEGVGLTYKNTPSSDSLTFSPGSWSFASPQKFLANFPVQIKKIYYKSLTTVNPTTPGVKELVKGALMIDIVADLTEDIGGSTTVGASFAVDLNTNARKFIPLFKGVFLDSLAVHANLPAVKIDGSILFRQNDPVFGNGFLGQLSVAFTSVGLGADALVEFGNTSYQNGNSLYRYWRVEADVTLPVPGVPFLPGLAFRGFGGGAYYNMDATLTTVGAHTLSGKKYTFKPKLSTFGLKIAATIATTPKEETFNADVALDAQFSKAQGLIFIGFSGNFYVGAGLDAASRSKAQISGNVGVSYNFPDKHFNLSASVAVNAPPITTPASHPASLVLDINGKTNKWSFKFGEPGNLDTVIVFNASLYEYLMFGNDITAPTGFTPGFRSGYSAVFPGSVPGMVVKKDGVTNSNTQTGKGLALGIGFVFYKEYNFPIPLFTSYSEKLKLTAGAELDLAFAEYNGNSCEPPYNRIGLNGWQASGDIGFYASAQASVTDGSSSWNLADIRVGGWLSGKFPNPVYVAGALQGNVLIGHFTTWTHLLGDWNCKPKFPWTCSVTACVHPQDHYLVNTSFNYSFTYGTDCGNLSAASTGPAPVQGDAAGSQQQLLIQYVHPSEQYDFPVKSPLAVQYGLVPDTVFDVSEQQSNGSVKSRTFKMVVSTSLKMKNDNGSFTNQALKTSQDNLGEFLYTDITPIVINTSTPMASSVTLAQNAPISVNNNSAGFSTNINPSYTIGNSTVITYPPSPAPSGYSNLPPEPPAINNNLTINKDYIFTVTATLKEYVNNAWINAKNKNNAVVTQTITKNLKTGPQFIPVSTSGTSGTAGH
jgi:hypothetical protein